MNDSFNISISHDFPGVQRELDKLQKGIGEPALVRALNGVTAQAKTAMSKEIRAEFNIPAAKVNQALRVQRARMRNGALMFDAVLESPTQRGRSLNIISFQARETRKGISFKIKKGGSRHVIAGAFIGNKGRTVFVREEAGDMPSRVKYGGSLHSRAIRAVQTIDVAQMFNTKRIHAKVVRVIREKFPEIFAREVKYYTDKFNARASA